MVPYPTCIWKQVGWGTWLTRAMLGNYSFPIKKSIYRLQVVLCSCLAIWQSWCTHTHRPQDAPCQGSWGLESAYFGLQTTNPWLYKWRYLNYLTDVLLWPSIKVAHFDDRGDTKSVVPGQQNPGLKVHLHSIPIVWILFKIQIFLEIYFHIGALKMMIMNDRMKASPPREALGIKCTPGCLLLAHQRIHLIHSQQFTAIHSNSLHKFNSLYCNTLQPLWNSKQCTVGC